MNADERRWKARGLSALIRVHRRPNIFRTAFLLWLGITPLAAGVQRVVVLKLDGVPHDLLEHELTSTIKATGKSGLPWIDRVFARGGVRLNNFYVRAISLSTPSWSLLDTGRHLEIRGNAEFDRYTYHVYDYLNFFPFYVGYALSSRVDMPGVQVLDELGIPLLIDRFPYEETYQGFQLFQRGVRWKTLQRSIQSKLSRSLRELLDEWTIGVEIGSSIEEQTERELITKLSDPRVHYLDYFTGEFDHVAHSTPDPASQRLALQRIDALVGRIWTAIQASPLAAETALIVVSDHGMNTRPGIYSQGYDLVRFFNSRAGGAHHVVTDRHPMTEYKLKGLDPFVSEVVTPSEESLYLKGAGDQYPTALLDLDGNERASIYLRRSDWNALHILLEEMNRPSLAAPVRRAAMDGFFRIVERHRIEWQQTSDELREELGALLRLRDSQRIQIQAQPAKWTPAQRDAGLDKSARRMAVQRDAWREQESGYSSYAATLARILALTPADFETRRFTARDLIPRRAMGDANTVSDLANYVIGPGKEGLIAAPDGSLDFERSFERVNYVATLPSLAVRNSVQAGVGPHPVDFIAKRIPRESVSAALGSENDSGEDGVWLSCDEAHQAVLLSRHDPAGNLELRYLPVESVRQDTDGTIRFHAVEPAPGFPLRIFEDSQFAVPENQRREWLAAWHSDLDWLHAVHRTTYSNGIIALHEQFFRESRPGLRNGDAGLLERFNARKRRLAEPDFVVFANDHWNFNVRGFNPGGNHGSLLRISSHSVLMLAGGDRKGIPRNLSVDEPYDSLSFVPTILKLMDRNTETAPLPGRLIREVLPQPAPVAP